MHSADYVELHAHTAYSFQDGASQPDELVAAAAQLGYTHLAITDHDSLAGAMEFAQAARAFDVRGIIGAEVTVIDDLGVQCHVTLLARTLDGYNRLCRVITTAHRPRVPIHRRRARSLLGEQPPGRVPSESAVLLGSAERPHPQVTVEQLVEHAEGLVCLTGCWHHGLLVPDVAGQRSARALDKLARLRAGFGEDLYVELQLPFQQGDAARNRALRQLAGQAGVPVVATGNVHAHSRLRARLHEVLVAIRNNTSLEACEAERAGNLALQLVSPAAMAERFRDHPDAVANTRRIAERIEFDLTDGLGYRYPGMRRDEHGSSIRELRGLCETALHERFGGRATLQQARERLDEELRLIERHELADFFLLHHDVLELAREVALDVRGANSARALGPPGRGRGSSVESIVCYLTGLSHVDPFEHDLRLGRFLNEDLRSVPDIDLDFPRDIRHELLRRVVDRYGDERCAMVAAHATFRARSAIRYVGAALGLPEGDLQRIAQRCGTWSAHGVAEVVDGTGPRWEAFKVLTREVADLPRQIGLHSGGVVISTDPLCEIVPLQPAATAGRQMCQWDKDSVDDAGFLKIDVLGLGMLSSVEECVESVSAHTGEVLDLSRIDYDDEAVYDQIEAGDTVGTFQIESRAQIASIQRVKPRNLADLTVQVAIIRPGPIVGDSVNPFIEARERLRADPSYEAQIDYGHESLREVLRDTHGAIIFQDQVIEVAMAFAGFRAGEADGLRKAMTRKRAADAIEAYRRRFIEGAARTHGADEATAQRIFDRLTGFAKYGFPRAHSAAFAILAYQSAWLRHYWTAHWYTALLNAQPMGFYPPNALLGDAARHGVQALPVDVNASQVLCTAHGTHTLRIGMAFVKGLAYDDATALVTEREQSGPFDDLADLARRAPLRDHQLERLITAGATACFAGDRRRQLWEIGTVARPRREQEPLALQASEAPALAQLSLWDEMVQDFATTGMSVRAHPMELLRELLPARVLPTNRIRAAGEGAVIDTAGLIIAVQRPGTAKGVVFALIEDEHGTVNVVFRPELGRQLRARLRSERIVRVRGRVQLRKGILSVQALELELVPQALRRDAANIPAGRQFH